MMLRVGFVMKDGHQPLNNIPVFLGRLLTAHGKPMLLNCLHQITMNCELQNFNF